MNFNVELFKNETKKIGLSIGEDVISSLDRFAGMLIETNKVMNLTAILDPDGIAVKHFADSLSILKAADFFDNARVLDMGTGAGFPGVPLLIAKPGIDLTLMDSTAKKLGFVQSSIDNLGLSAVTLHSRAEDAGKSEEYRESFDFVVSRAVASLNVLCEYCLPFVKKGGCFIAMKGAAAQDEIKQAYTAIKTMGGEIEKTIDFELSDGARSLVVIKKISNTPAKYPRNSGQIKSKPL